MRQVHLFHLKQVLMKVKERWKHAMPCLLALEILKSWWNCCFPISQKEYTKQLPTECLCLQLITFVQ